MTADEFNARRLALDEQWTREIEARVKAVAMVIYPLLVSDGFVRHVAYESDIADAHAQRVEALEREFYQL